MARSSVPAGAQEWRARAACRARDAAQFFSGDGERMLATRQGEARAKSVCAQCLVRPECAAAALTAREEHGVWGGFTRRERTRLLALGWTDLADHRRTAVDVTGLERRLISAAAEPAPQPRTAPVDGSTGHPIEPSTRVVPR